MRDIYWTLILIKHCTHINLNLRSAHHTHAVLLKLVTGCGVVINTVIVIGLKEILGICKHLEILYILY